MNIQRRQSRLKILQFYCLYINCCHLVLFILDCWGCFDFLSRKFKLRGHSRLNWELRNFDFLIWNSALVPPYHHVCYSGHMIQGLSGAKSPVKGIPGLHCSTLIAGELPQRWSKSKSFYEQVWYHGHLSNASGPLFWRLL